MPLCHLPSFMQPRRKGDSVVSRNRVCSDCRLQKMKSLPEADIDTLCPFAVIPSFESRKMVVHVKKPSDGSIILAR